jgi:hypothetical protein
MNEMDKVHKALSSQGRLLKDLDKIWNSMKGQGLQSIIKKTRHWTMEEDFFHIVNIEAVFDEVIIKTSNL